MNPADRFEPSLRNNDRALSALIREIAAQHDISVAEFSDAWLYCLTKHGRSRYILGYDFDLNPAASQLIAKDKSATSDILGHHGIPRIEHVLFHHPQMAKYVPFTGNWERLMNFALAHEFDLVCKPNTGSGGVDVHRVKTQQQLELAVQELFARTRAIAVSPFADIRNEFRVVVLNGKSRVAYAKIRPSVTGDGVRSMLALVAERLAGATSRGSSQALAYLAESDVDLNAVPAAGEICSLNWRHNLGQGSSVRVLSWDELRQTGLDDLALSAAGCLNLKFASVDIVEVDGRLLVLEINAGIMMESFATLVKNGYQIVRQLYEDALLSMFGESSAS
jgi:glutathione synthase/RimK-type ligase-like ATP-grasp enzyme